MCYKIINIHKQRSLIMQHSAIGIVLFLVSMILSCTPNTRRLEDLKFNQDITVYKTFAVDKNIIPSSAMQRINQGLKKQHAIYYLPVRAKDFETNIDQIKEKITFNTWLESIPKELSPFRVNITGNISTIQLGSVMSKIDEPIIFNFTNKENPLVSFNVSNTHKYKDEPLSRIKPLDSSSIKKFDTWISSDEDLSKAQSLYSIKAGQDIRLLFIQIIVIESKTHEPSVLLHGKHTAQKHTYYYLNPLNINTLNSSPKYTVQ